MGLRSGHPQRPRAKALGGPSPGEARLGRGRCLRYIETAWDAGPPPRGPGQPEEMFPKALGPSQLASAQGGCSSLPVQEPACSQDSHST